MSSVYLTQGLVLLRYDIHELFNRWDHKKGTYVPIANPKQEFAFKLETLLKDIALDPHDALKKYRLMLFPSDAKNREQIIGRYRLTEDIANRLIVTCGVYSRMGNFSYKQGNINRHGESEDVAEYLSLLWENKRLAPYGLPVVATLGVHLHPSKK